MEALIPAVKFLLYAAGIYFAISFVFVLGFIILAAKNAR